VRERVLALLQILYRSLTDLLREREKKNQNSLDLDPEQGTSPDLSDQSEDRQSTIEQPLETTEWDQFSAPGAEPEFFEFVVKRTAKLPQPPADPLCAAESWIRKQGHILYHQYLTWKQKQEQLAKQQETGTTEVPPPPSPAVETMTPQMWLERYQQMWQAGPGVQPYICQAMAEGRSATPAQHPERGLQMGQNGPELVSQ
jgi:hypothetical protein